jgi:4-amino-4-deoxy-L-arabinose transferase-like glycosyltransferase
MSVPTATGRPELRPNNSAGVDGRARPTTAEWLVLGAILAAAFVARFWAFSLAGMGHFDEGVYLISALGIAEAPHDLFPNQINFSPPFYFMTVGVATWLFGGDPERIAILVNVLIGTATVAATWWIGRAWYGARAAAIAALLLALNQFHILVSRVTLTDAAFAFWFVLALGAIVLAVDRQDFRIAVLAGVLTGLAWNTKYHGWFALLITGVALVPALWRGRKDGTYRRPLGVWLTATAVAAVVYAPWAAYMRHASGSGGYGSIISYYATMLGIDWGENLWRQMGQQAFLEGVLTRAAPLLALGAGLLVDRRLDAMRRLAAVLGGLAVLSLLIGQAGVGALLALAAVPALLRAFDAYHARVMICWIGLWIVSAPIYHPYARLILPFTIASFLLAGFVLDRMLGRATSAAASASAPIFALAAAAVVGLLAANLRDDPGDPWFPSRDIPLAADAIAQVAGDARVYVIGEPPLVYHLRRRDVDSPARTDFAMFDTLSATAYLVTGVYTNRAPALRSGVDALGARLTQVQQLPFVPNDLRILDGFRPDEARRYRAAPDSTYTLTLYRLAPAAR